MDIRELIGKKMLYFDGGLGTLLQAEGLQPGEEPERWNLSHPDIIEKVHFSYYQAGCHIVTTDSLGCNELNFPEEGSCSVESIAKAAVENARRARSHMDELDGGAEPRFIAFSIGSLGRLLKPLGTLPFEDAYKIFSRTVKAADAAGADMIAPKSLGDIFNPTNGNACQIHFHHGFFY